MEIRVMKFLQGAAQAEGLAVVIDVFRAGTTACMAFARGAGRILPTDDLETAFALRRAEPGAILVGERDCIRPPGFDYGNSPTELETADLAGRTVIHATSAGTRGLAAATGADEVLFGSFAAAPAIVEYIRNRAPKKVSLVAMGTAGTGPAPEDDMCAQYLKNELEGFPNDFERIREFLRTVPSAAKFFDPEKDYAPERDFDLCLDLGRFDFFPRLAGNRDQGLVLNKTSAVGD